MTQLVLWQRAQFAYGGTALVPCGPFRRWLAAVRAELGTTNCGLARSIGVSETTIRYYLNRAPRVNVRTVERYGIALTNEPRLHERLYP